MWLTRACRPILLKSTVFVHQIHLAAYGLLDTSCTHSAKSVFRGCTEFPAFTLLVGRQEEYPACKKTEWWGTGWSEVQMICIWFSWCHCHPIISCFSKIQNGLPVWCRLTQAVQEKRRLNGSSSSSCCTEFPEFSTFREIPEYSRFVATLEQVLLMDWMLPNSIKSLKECNTQMYYYVINAETT